MTSKCDLGAEKIRLSRIPFFSVGSLDSKFDITSFVHLASDEVAIWCIVARVQSREPLSYSGEQSEQKSNLQTNF